MSSGTISNTRPMHHGCSPENQDQQCPQTQPIVSHIKCREPMVRGRACGKCHLLIGSMRVSDPSGPLRYPLRKHRAAANNPDYLRALKDKVCSYYSVRRMQAGNLFHNRCPRAGKMNSRHQR